MPVMAVILVMPIKITYRVRVREGAPEATQVLRVKAVPVMHIAQLNLLLLLFGQGCLLVHAARELVCPLSLCPMIWGKRARALISVI